ncbi:MAG: peptidoglycan DD-metalloendopeptidase family protein [Burkholderiales bacterium]
MTRTAWGLIAATLVVVGCASPQGAAPVFDRTARAAQPSSAAGARAVAPPASVPTAAPAPAGNAGDYVVRRGDTLYSIALEQGVAYRELAQWNALDDPARLRVGQVLRVTRPAQSGITVGRIGSARIESRALEAAPVKSTGAPAPLPAGAEPLKFVWPAKGNVIAVFEQTRGKGLDIDGRVGDPVLAAARGKVTYVGSGIRGLGKMLIIQHNDEFLTVYAHTSQIVVKEQQTVQGGQKIAEIGKSDAERPMLHFQIRKLGRPLDPKQFLPGV